MSEQTQLAPKVASGEVRKQNTPNDAPKNRKEILEMLMYEELARARIRDLEEALSGQRAPARGARWLDRWQGRKPRHSGSSTRSSSKSA
ncbi:hypothetical protein [Amycolatopsis palatopharyngis]|uniref:hypothetical protein n=1 Tax=Amycolatopsis palatopharyngis TaxID=187982 RepID=UPI000E270731|nr:hypothetical protein [Amycolatopsis palatopharyngis]